MAGADGWAAVGLLLGSLAAQAADSHDIEFCNGYFALCSAATCTPTGRTIRVNVASGGTAQFPEARCVCPIFRGAAIADLSGGNMRGSCEAPSAETIWSEFAFHALIPQQINNWAASGKEATAPHQICPKALRLGAKTTNCFSFLCDSKRYINGTPVANCHCAIGESLSGTPIAPATTFLTQAGQLHPKFCAAHPVAGPTSVP